MSIYTVAPVSVAITHKYVRFKPSSHQQHSILIDLDIDLSDYPLDYEVIQEGDYYNDGATPAEQIPWLYAVVNTNFIPPSGITYEVLQQIHVPVLAAVENEAFRITGNPIDNNTCSGTTAPAAAGVTPMAEPPGGCPTGTQWDPITQSCVPNAPTPPPPAPTRQPSGIVNVFDLELRVDRPVRNARIVARRFLKIERTFTDNQGQYFLNKEFNRVRILVKMKNDQAIIRGLRRARLWQILNPVVVNLGRFRGTLNNQIHFIGYNANAMSRGARDWAAATAHNNVQEFRDFSTQLGLGFPPNKLRVLLTNWRRQGTAGAAPLFAKRAWSSVPNPFISFYIISNASLVAGGFSQLAAVLAAEIDITMGYNLLGNDLTAGSSRISEVMFHEQAHAAHYARVGNVWYGNFVNAELAELTGNGPDPYGTGQTANSPIIALGESWAFHLGHFMADRKYGINAERPTEQNIVYGNGGIFENGVQVANTGLPQHLNLLEDFSPRRPVDPFRWIPQGLYYDLMDNRNDNIASPRRVPLVDNVINYTNQQFFNALDLDISTLPNYRLRLLNENGNNQAAGVNTIFTFYGY